MTETIRPIAPTCEVPSPALLLSIDVTAGTVGVHGDLDRRHADRLIEAVAVLVHSPSPCWSIDVSAAGFCDASGLRSLLEAQRLASLSGRTFHVARPGPWLRRLLPMVGVGTVGLGTVGVGAAEGLP